MVDALCTRLWGPASAGRLWGPALAGPLVTVRLQPDPSDRRTWHRGTVAPGTQRGYTFIELLVVSTIILILASAIMPLARVTATRQREAELRRSLREIRTAIDKFKDAADAGQIGSFDLKPENSGYPADLDVLGEGVS